LSSARLREGSMRKLASAIAKLEGKKHEASIGDVREILKIIKKLIKENPDLALELLPKHITLSIDA
jgi:hypothetical protein